MSSNICMFDGDMVTVPQQHRRNVQRSTHGIDGSHSETNEITTIIKLDSYFQFNERNEPL